MEQISDQARVIKFEKIFELGLLIPLITIFAIASIYYYEMGYFDFFKIPFEFIQIEYSKNIFLIFTFIAISFAVIFFSQPMLNDWPIIKGQRIRWLNLIAAILFPSVILTFLGVLIKSLFHFQTLCLLISFCVGVLLLIYKKDKAIESFVQENVLIRKVANFGADLLGSILVTCTSICLLMYSVGYLNALFKELPVNSSGKKYLLRNYGEYRIYLLDKRNDTNLYYIISKSSSDSDTLKIPY